MPVDPPPKFVADSPLLAGAFELAREAHHGAARKGGTDIAHPTAVAQVLHDNGFEENIVAAALLHDVVEDTDVDAAEIAARFGPDIGLLVEEMTENQGIEAYSERKAEHRDRVGRDRRAAAIYAADKLASTRRLTSGDELPEQKRRHYLETLRMLCERHPDLPFLADLREELRRLGAGDGELA